MVVQSLIPHGTSGSKNINPSHLHHTINDSKKMIIRNYFVLILLSQLCFAQEAVRNLADLNSIAWKEEWSTAKGSFKATKDIPTGANVDKQSSMAINIAFETGFQYYNLGLVDKKIPGKIKSMSVWAKRSGAAVPLTVGFKMKNHPKDKKFEWSLKLTNDWHRFHFEIPGDWPELESFSLTSARLDYRLI